MKLKISWLFAMVFLGFAVYYFLESRKLKATIDEHLRVFSLVREELDAKEVELESYRRLSQQPGGSSTASTSKLRVQGEFLGWNGQTIFRLSDGTTWQQAKHDVFFYRANDPEVILEQGAGKFFLSLPGTGKKVEVRQL